MSVIMDKINTAIGMAKEAHGTELPVDDGVIIQCNDASINLHIVDDELKIDISDGTPIIVKIDYSLDVFERTATPDA